MRRPTLRDGELLPWVGCTGALLLTAGVLAWGQPAALWLATIGVLCLATFALVAWRLLYGAALSAGLWLLGCAWALASLPDRIGTTDTTRARAYWPLLLLIGLALLAVTGAAMRRGRSGTRGQVSRWARRSRRNHGVASRWQVLKTASAYTLRRRAAILRPSLTRPGPRGWWARWSRRRTPVTHLGTRLARVGLLGVVVAGRGRYHADRRPQDRQVR
jgi:hypothetical protein